VQHREDRVKRGAWQVEWEAGFTQGGRIAPQVVHCGAPRRAQACHQALAVAEHFGIVQAQQGDAALFQIARLGQIETPARLRPVVAAVNFDRQTDRRKVKIDHPVAHRPLAPELACQRTGAELAQDAFQFGFGRRWFEAAQVGGGIALFKRWRVGSLLARAGHRVLSRGSSLCHGCATAKRDG